MPISILMPALSPTMTEGTLAKWLKKEGDVVKAGNVIAEIETDKATMEVEAVDEGILTKILVPAGTGAVKVNALIAILLEEGEDASGVDAFIAKHGSENLADPVTPVSSSPAVNAPKSSPQSATSISSSKENVQRVFASPLARRLASERGLDLSGIKGSGPRGRIIRADVEAAGTSGSQQRTPLPQINYSADGMPSYRAEPVSGMRKVIAQRLTESKQTIPHFYLTVEIEMDALLALREAFNKAQQDVKVSINDMLIKAIGLALKQVPEANASWAGTEMRFYDAADVSVAVAVPGGLVTPVVRQADNRSLTDISREMKRLAEAARAGKLKPEEWQGGTFTLSNLGMFGIQEFGAIINPPQAGILAVGTSTRCPVVREGDSIEIATLMRATLSADHRVVDGAVGAKWLSVLREVIENPLKLIL